MEPWCRLNPAHSVGHTMIMSRLKIPGNSGINPPNSGNTKVIIAGSRNVTDLDLVAGAIEASGFPISEVVSGGAPGVDTLAEQWAREHGIPVTRFPAEWSRYGRRAGPIRNKEMAVYGEALIVVWDGKRAGTKSSQNIR
jgi:hypothetical protein